MAPHTRDEEAASTRGEKAACTKGEEGGTRAAARIGVVRRQRGERGGVREWKGKGAVVKTFLIWVRRDLGIERVCCSGNLASFINIQVQSTSHLSCGHTLPVVRLTLEQLK